MADRRVWWKIGHTHLLESSRGAGLWPEGSTRKRVMRATSHENRARSAPERSLPASGSKARLRQSGFDRRRGISPHVGCLLRGVPRRRSGSWASGRCHVWTSCPRPPRRSPRQGLPDMIATQRHLGHVFVAARQALRGERQRVSHLLPTRHHLGSLTAASPSSGDSPVLEP